MAGDAQLGAEGEAGGGRSAATVAGGGGRGATAAAGLKKDCGGAGGAAEGKDDDDDCLVPKGVADDVLLRWLDRQVRLKLANIDHKLDELSLQVGRRGLWQDLDLDAFSDDGGGSRETCASLVNRSVAKERSAPVELSFESSVGGGGDGEGAGEQQAVPRLLGTGGARAARAAALAVAAAAAASAAGAASAAEDGEALPGPCGKQQPAAQPSPRGDDGAEEGPGADPRRARKGSTASGGSGRGNSNATISAAFGAHSSNAFGSSRRGPSVVSADGAGAGAGAPARGSRRRASFGSADGAPNGEASTAPGRTSNTQPAARMMRGSRSSVDSARSLTRTSLRAFRSLAAAAPRPSQAVPPPPEPHALVRRRATRWEGTEKIWQFIEDAESGPAAKAFGHFMPAFTLVTVCVTLLQSVEQSVISPRNAGALEIFFDTVFIAEISMRFAVCPNRCLFFCNPYNHIDIIAALPFFCRLAIGPTNVVRKSEDLNAVDWYDLMICVVPVLRLMKTLRRFSKFKLLLSAFQESVEALPVLLFCLSILTLVFSSMIYLCEPRWSIGSLPAAMWFAIVTITSTGYGDIVPRTPVGHVGTSVFLVLSVLFLAMPLGLIGQAFNKTWEDRDRILLVQRTRERLIEWGYTPYDLPLIFKHFDLDGSGGVELTEFIAMLTAMRIGLGEKRITELFYLFDVDGSGSISPEEFVRNLFPQAFQQMQSDMVTGNRAMRLSTTADGMS